MLEDAVDIRVTCKCLCGGTVQIGVIKSSGDDCILHTIPMCEEYEKDQDPSVYIKKLRSYNEGSN
jgi:hypothetical protein